MVHDRARLRTADVFPVVASLPLKTGMLSQAKIAHNSGFIDFKVFCLLLSY